MRRTDNVVPVYAMPLRFSAFIQLHCLPACLSWLSAMSSCEMFDRLFTEGNVFLICLLKGYFNIYSFSSVHNVLILPDCKLLKNSLRSWRYFHSRQNFLLTSESFKNINILWVRHLIFLNHVLLPDIPLDLDRWKMMSSLVFFLLSLVSSLFLVAISFLQSLFR